MSLREDYRTQTCAAFYKTAHICLGEGVKDLLANYCISYTWFIIRKCNYVRSYRKIWRAKHKHYDHAWYRIWRAIHKDNPAYIARCAADEAGQSARNTDLANCEAYLQRQRKVKQAGGS